MSSPEKLDCRKWSSHPLHPRERFDAWHDALNASHLGWDLQKNKHRDFMAEVQVSKLKDIRVISCICQPCSGSRGKREIAADKQAYYGLLLMHEGEEEVFVGSRTLQLKPGKILLWDSTEPLRFKLHSPVHKTTVLVPQRLLKEVLPHIRSLVGRTLDWRRGMGAVAASHITALSAQASHIHQAQAHPAAETTLGLIANSLSRHQIQPRDATRDATIQRIKQYIDSHLSDPELGPNSVVRQFNISLRYLHLLFTGEALTVSRWIQERRIEKCRRG